MTKRKLLATGLVALAGVLAFTSDASAGRRKRNRGGCNDCSGYTPAYHAGGGGCGDCSGCGTAMGPGYGVPVAGMPQAMPAPGVATAPDTTQPGTVIPVEGTEGGPVTPASGTVVPPTTVIPQQSYGYPAGGYYQNGQYVYPAGYGSFQTGFGTGVVQGAAGTSYYTPYGSTIGGTVGNYAGQQTGRGLFRRR